MNWNQLSDLQTLDHIDELSQKQPVIIFKHSTRCAISASALNRIERNYIESNGKGFSWYFLDLLRHRDISNAIANRYGIEHESPQVLIIRNGQCVYHASHSEIRYDEMIAH